MSTQIINCVCRRCGKRVSERVGIERVQLVVRTVLNDSTLPIERCIRFLKQTYLCKRCITWLAEHEPNFTMSGEA